MLTDSNGKDWWSDFWGWVLNGIIAVAFGTIASGGLLGAVLIGASVGALVSMGGSIIAQGGFANANPWQVLKAGVTGAVIGAISGAVSWGVGLIGQSVGQYLGYALSNTVHISSGIKIGNFYLVIFLIREI